jgi:sporulation protein YlmC with PRC-barrel domain
MEVAMKKSVAIMAGLALTGGMASVAQEQETYDPNRDIVTETEQDHGTGMEQTQRDTPVQSEYGTEPETHTESDMSTDPYGTQSQTETETQTDPYGTGTETETYGAEMGHDLSQMTSEELSGKTIVTTTGEEVGEVDEIGYSSTHQERVATVEVGGFLGVGERRIAIPLSELKMGEDDKLKTSLTRESIESQQEFDEEGFTADQ